jgi:ornithine carbamoyltransferase
MKDITMQDLLSFSDWSPQSMQTLLALALDLKQYPEKYGKPLAGKSVVAIFEKPSLRTRVSFDIGVNKLGGHLVYVDSQGSPLKDREDPVDVGANLACWADAIVSRVYEHQTLVDLAKGANIPVINALCDLYHPCQALADYLGMHEKLGELKGKTMAYIGDGNNVTHSLLIVGALLGVNQTVITPKGFEISAKIAKHAAKLAYENGVDLTIANAIDELGQADILYTDTWLSMGDDTPLSEIKEKFAPFQVNEDLMKKAGASYVMHCQPAHRDLEITGSLMDSEQSLLMLQAENRMHAQNAILASLIGGVTLA